jgi:hypothetical protein
MWTVQQVGVAPVSVRELRLRGWGRLNVALSPQVNYTD